MLYVDRNSIETTAPVKVDEPSEFADIIDAVRGYLDGHALLWTIGDLLIEHCGQPGKNGVRNGVTDKIKAVARELKRVFGERAQEFGFKYLERLRSTAARFPAPTRVGAVEFALHWAAGNPKTLQRAIAAAKQRKVKLTRDFIKNFRKNHQQNAKPDPIIEAMDILRLGLVEYANRAEHFVGLLTKAKVAHHRKLLADDLPDMMANAERIQFAMHKADRLVS
jgi:hypothetical protein